MIANGRRYLAPLPGPVAVGERIAIRYQDGTLYTHAIVESVERRGLNMEVVSRIDPPVEGGPLQVVSHYSL